MKKINDKNRSGIAIDFLKNHKSFFAALMALFAVLLMVYTCSAMLIHPITASAASYRRTWVWFILTAAAFFAVSVFMAAHFFVRPVIKNIKFSTVLVAAVAFAGMVYMFVLPPMSAPDEIRHYLTAYKLSNQMMFKEAATDEGYVYMRAEDANLLLNDHPGHNDYAVFLNNWTGTADEETVLYTEETAQPNPWIAYLPQAIGITLARLLHLRQIPLMMLARFFNFAFFMAFFAAALKFMPFGKEFMGVCAMLPMTLELVSSMSYDAFILALSFFYIAYVLYLAFSKPRVSLSDMAVVTVIMAVLGPIKMVYVTLALLMFIIPKEKFGSVKRYALCALGMAAAICVCYLAAQMGKVTEYVQETNTHLEYADAESYTLSWVLENKLDTVKIILNSIRTLTGSWFEQMTGSLLGWFDVPIPDIAVYMFMALLLAAAVRPADEPVYFKTSQRLSSGAVLLVTTLLLVFAMFLAYTPAGSLSVAGVQGRYFLPVLPLSFVIFRCQSVRRDEGTTGVIIYSAFILNFWTAVSAIAHICSRVGETQMLTNL